MSGPIIGPSGETIQSTNAWMSSFESNIGTYWHDFVVDNVNDFGVIDHHISMNLNC